MYVQGMYLHSKLATNVFDNKAPFWLYYSIGWGKTFTLRAYHSLPHETYQ